MFLLCEDDIMRDDGTVSVNLPFMIALPNGLDAFAAFPTRGLAEYFRRMVRLRSAYKAVDLGVIDERKLHESRYLYAFSTPGDVDRLFSENQKDRCRMEKVMEIAGTRPDSA